MVRPDYIVNIAIKAIQLSRSQTKECGVMKNPMVMLSDLDETILTTDMWSRMFNMMKDSNPDDAILLDKQYQADLEPIKKKYSFSESVSKSLLEAQIKYEASPELRNANRLAWERARNLGVFDVNRTQIETITSGVKAVDGIVPVLPELVKANFPIVIVTRNWSLLQPRIALYNLTPDEDYKKKMLEVPICGPEILSEKVTKEYTEFTRNNHFREIWIGADKEKLMEEIAAEIMERRTDDHLFEGVTKLYVGDSCNDLPMIMSDNVSLGIVAGESSGSAKMLRKHGEGLKHLSDDNFMSDQHWRAVPYINTYHDIGEYLRDYCGFSKAIVYIP
jgi:hypothetical protein